MNDRAMVSHLLRLPAGCRPDVLRHHLDRNLDRMVTLLAAELGGRIRVETHTVARVPSSRRTTVYYLSVVAVRCGRRRRGLPTPSRN